MTKNQPNQIKQISETSPAQILERKIIYDTQTGMSYTIVLIEGNKVHFYFKHYFFFRHCSLN